VSITATFFLDDFVLKMKTARSPEKPAPSYLSTRRNGAESGKKSSIQPKKMYLLPKLS
jgi:hypothetical protein